MTELLLKKINYYWLLQKKENESQYIFQSDIVCMH